MIQISEKFLIDRNGKQVAVLIDIDDYEKILEELEELDALRTYDAAKEAEDEAIPFEQAIVEIEQSRQ